MNRCSIWNRLVSVLSLWLQPFKSYDPFSGVMYEERRVVIGNMQLNPCVSSTKFKQTMKGSLRYSESIYVHFGLNKAILQELWIFFACVYTQENVYNYSDLENRMSLVSRTSNVIAMRLEIFALLY